MRVPMILLAAALSACVPTSSEPQANPGVPKLLFASGFEGGVALAPLADGYQQIKGRDHETGFSWPIDILGARGSALHPIDHDNQNALFNHILSTTGPDGGQTQALFSQQNYVSAAPNDATQSPYEILDIRDGRRDLYVRYWIKLDRESLHQPNMWRTFFEWKSTDYANGTGFRLISFIYTDDDGAPYFVWQGDANPQRPIWEIENHQIPVPENEWFLTEFYWRWSEGADGRAIWRVNGQVVGDHSGPTTRNSKPIDFIMLTQIYGNANPKHQWVDDIEIWSDWPAKAGAKP